MQRETENSNGFLDELKSQFERDMEVRNNLDSKSTHLITMSSTIVTILVSIGTFLVSKIGVNPIIEPIYPFAYPLIFYVSLLILGLGIILSTFCILYLTKSYAIRKYRYPMGHEVFFKGDKYQQELADKFRNYSSETFNKHIVKEYLESIKNNSETISHKAGMIKKGQKFLNPAIGSIAVLLVFILLTFGMNLIKVNF